MPDHIARGESQLLNAARLVSNLSPDKVWRISVSEYRARRSGEQNDRFHKLISLLADETGEDPKRLKEWAKAEFGPVVIVEVGGASKTVPKPSHEYTVEEMSVVMDRFEAFCAREMGVMLG